MGRAYTLKELCQTEITDGTHQTPIYSNSGYIFLSSKNVTKGKIDWENVSYIPESLHIELYSRISPQRDDILLAKNGTTGVAAIVDKDEIFDIYVSLALIRPDHRLVLPRFLLYALNSDSSKRYFDSHLKGIGVPNLHLNHIRETPIWVPSLDNQRLIISKLDKLNDLISFRKQQLTKLDELVKARFVEMFGDPVSNPRGWDTAPLVAVTAKIGSGATPKGGKESYQVEGITLIRSMNVHDGCFVYKELAHINKEQAEQLNSVVVFEKDVFINITGASVARSCIVPENVLPARVNQHVAIIRCKQTTLNPIFANQQFLNPAFKKKLLELGEAGGATRQAITKQQLEALEVILPPIEVQNQFAYFVEQTNELHLTIRRSLDKLEVLKKSLMQEYFG